jgi:hypothetical protein
MQFERPAIISQISLTGLVMETEHVFCEVEMHFSLLSLLKKN